MDEINVKFIKHMAQQAGHSISDEEAELAHKKVIEELEEDYYYKIADYFKN